MGSNYAIKDSIQLFFPTEVKKTFGEEKGLFSKTKIPKGSVVGNFGYKAEMMTEKEYSEALDANNHIITITGVRWIGKYFLYGNEVTSTEYVNHSFSPTLLYHCGIIFAKRDILEGEELTVNYQYFLSENENEKFIDFTTGKIVAGMNATQSLKESTKELMEILKDERTIIK